MLRMAGDVMKGQERELTSRMRVVQVGMDWFPEVAGGGLDRFFAELLPRLSGVNIEARGLVAGSARVETDSRGQVRGFAVREVPLLKRLRAARAAIVRLVSEFEPDLISAHFALYAFSALDRLAGRPLVAHFHGPWADESEGSILSHWSKALIERAVYQRACRLIVLSRAFGKELRQRYRISEDIVRVVPGAVDASRFELGCSRAEARQRLGWPKDRPIVLSVRRLVNRMGLEDLIEATAQLRQRVSDVLVIIAGRGPLEPVLGQRVAERDLGAHVRLVGFVAEENLPWAYRAADLSVVPTVTLEGFGLITIESMAAGTPALVTPVGGLLEAVGNLSPHLVLPETGAQALAEGLRSALLGSLPLPSAEQCQAYVRTNFDWPVIAAQVRGVYLEALA
jgi:glycosyltransferase involved in cell wall biosynthesis